MTKIQMKRGAGTSALAQLVIVAGVCSLTALTGCIAPSNDRLAINSIETQDTDAGVQETSVAYRPLETVGRREWAPLTYTIPVDSVVHSPTHASTVELTTKTARQRGAFPTLESAYDTSEGSLNQQIKEALIAPGYGFFQGLSTIVMVFIHPATNGVESPEMAYQRSAPKAALRPAFAEIEGVSLAEDETER